MNWFWGIVCTLQAIVILILIVDKATGDILEHIFSALFKHVPKLYRSWPWLLRLWGARQLRKSLRTQLRSLSRDAFDIDVRLKFAEGPENKSFLDGKKLVVMYHPGENRAENFVNVAVSTAQHCIPNAKRILNDDLRQCVTLTLAKTIIDSHDPTCARLFSDRYLLSADGKSNVLASNKYFPKIEALDKKRLFSRLYLKSIMQFGASFNVLGTEPEIQATTDKFTKALSELAEHFLSRHVPALVDQTSGTVEDGFEFFFNENGLSVNIMLVRSDTAFRNRDIGPYLAKATALCDRGVVHFYVLNAVTNINNVTRGEFLERTTFAEQVVATIKRKEKRLALKAVGKQEYMHLGLPYPLYCALFVKAK